MPASQPLFSDLQIITVQTNNTTITSKLSTSIYSNIYSPLIQNTICKSSGLTPTTYNCIDWENHSSAMSTLSHAQKIAISKHVHNLWHTSAKENIHHAEHPSNCLICHHPIETSLHVLTCPVDTATCFRTTSFMALLDSIKYLQLPQTFCSAWAHGLLPMASSISKLPYFLESPSSHNHPLPALSIHLIA